MMMEPLPSFNSGYYATTSSLLPSTRSSIPDAWQNGTSYTSSPSHLLPPAAYRDTIEQSGSVMPSLHNTSDSFSVPLQLPLPLPPTMTSGMGVISQTRSHVASPHLRPMVISPPPDCYGNGWQTQGYHMVPMQSQPGRYTPPPYHYRAEMEQPPPRFIDSPPQPTMLPQPPHPAPVPMARPIKRRRIEEEDKNRALVQNDENGRKSLVLPPYVLHALYNENWEEVSSFLSANSETLFPGMYPSHMPMPLPTPTSCSPTAVSHGPSTEGAAPLAQPPTASSPASGSDAIERLTGILSVKTEERLRIYNNVNVVMTSDTSVHMEFTMSPLIPTPLRLSLQRPDSIKNEPVDETTSTSSNTIQSVESVPPSLPCIPSATRADPCILWKGPYRKAKGRCYPIISFPQLKIYNMPVMKLLLCWKYPAEARKHELMSTSFRKVISNTCGNPACLEERHCRIKAVFEHGRFL